MLDEARRGTLPGMVRTGATFPDAAAEYMRWIEHDRARKPSTARDHHSILKAHLLPTFGEMRLEDITTEGVERWAAGLTVGGRINNRTKLKILTVLHGVMKRAKRVWKLRLIRSPTWRSRSRPSDRHRRLLAQGCHGSGPRCRRSKGLGAPALKVRPGRKLGMPQVAPPSVDRAKPMSEAPPSKNRPTWNAATAATICSTVGNAASNRRARAMVSCSSEGLPVELCAQQADEPEDHLGDADRFGVGAAVVGAAAASRARYSSSVTPPTASRTRSLSRSVSRSARNRRSARACLAGRRSP